MIMVGNWIKNIKIAFELEALCLKVNPKAHFDIPLYALPNEMFDDLTDASVKQDSSTVSKEEASTIVSKKAEALIFQRM